MSVVKFIRNFVNKNPRNIERLRLQPKPTGWEFENDQTMRNSTYKLF